MKWPTVILAFFIVACCQANEWTMPTSQFERFKNRADPKDGSGSCVQASLSMCGAHHLVPQFEYLLEPSQYGPAELGGSYPERVMKYAAARGVPIYSVEGSESLDWIFWALKRGAYVGVTYGQAHMICAVACAEDESWVEVCDNNYPSEIRRVSRDVFARQHTAYGGGWCVIIDTPGPPPWAKAGPMPR